MTTIYRTIELKPIKCWGCGCEFAVDEALYNNKKENKKTLHCPNGCSLSLGKSRADEVREKMEAELARVKRNNEYMEATAREQRRRADAAEKSLTATRGVVTRLKNRVGNGVCPCCNRTFADLQRHMHSQHPEFAKAEVVGG
jgi:hypothetical protein